MRRVDLDLKAKRACQNKQTCPLSFLYISEYSVHIVEDLRGAIAGKGKDLTLDGDEALTDG